MLLLLASSVLDQFTNQVQQRYVLHVLRLVLALAEVALENLPLDVVELHLGQGNVLPLGVDGLDALKLLQLRIELDLKSLV